MSSAEKTSKIWGVREGYIPRHRGGFSALSRRAMRKRRRFCNDRVGQTVKGQYGGKRRDDGRDRRGRRRRARRDDADALCWLGSAEEAGQRQSDSSSCARQRDSGGRRRRSERSMTAGARCRRRPLWERIQRAARSRAQRQVRSRGTRRAHGERPRHAHSAAERLTVLYIPGHALSHVLRSRTFQPRGRTLDRAFGN